VLLFFCFFFTFKPAFEINFEIALSAVLGEPPRLLRLARRRAYCLPLCSAAQNQIKKSRRIIATALFLIIFF
jgi:hypothetical protein